MELHDRLALITAALLSNPNNGTLSDEDIVARAATINDEIESYEHVDETEAPYLPERGGPDTVND